MAKRAARRPGASRALPMLDWMVEQAQKRLQRQRRLRRWCIGVSTGITALTATIIAQPRLLFVWNASPSADIGLYFVSGKSWLARGDMAAVWLPERHRRLASDRRYLPYNIPAIKRVVAVPGDSVCALGGRIAINGQWIADRHRFDGKGRPMPWWHNCKRLGPDELFLLNEEAANSFDGRYIGISKRSDVIGEARLIWRD
jgi:conjugative transfer signal peptidase TraF